MRLERTLHIGCRREEAALRLADDAVLLDLIPDADSEIVERRGERRTLESRYEFLGTSGVATFHFDRTPNGDIHFEKVCDGRVWQELTGSILLEDARSGTEVRLELEGRTRRLVPELAIRAPLQAQLEQMSRALGRLLKG